MRCLILIALCFVVANASYYNKNRFHKLLNRYQQPRYHQRYNQELLGSDDTDDYIDDYVEEIRRERGFERDQCPRGLEDILGREDDEYDTYNTEDNYRQRRHPTEDNEDMYRQRRYPTEDMEDEYRQRRHPMEDMDDIFRQRKYPTEDNDNEDIFHQRQRRHQRRYPTEDMEEFGRRFTGEDMEDVLGEESEIRSPLLKEVRDANIKLATRLYEQCKQEKDDKNTVVSPLSVQLALAILNSGARGNTRRQIGHVIGGNLKTQERKQVFRTLVRHLKGFRNMEYSTRQHTTKINTVTGIFVSQRTQAQHTFIQQVKGVLGATVKHCTFSQQPQQCRRQINQWVAQKTHGKISHIVPQDAITDNTKMILVNALELKATWGPQMRRHQTKEAKFYPLDSKKVKIVEVMETEGKFKYYEDELVKIVGIPTKQRELTLYTIVPKDKDGLTDVEKLHLQDNIQLKDLLKKTDLHHRRVHVQLPKFQIKHKVDVRRTLRKQGVTDAFDTKRADFSGITGVSKYQQDQMEETSYRRNPFMDIESEYGQEGMFGQRNQRWNRNQFDTEEEYRQQSQRRNPFLDMESEYGQEGMFGQRSQRWNRNQYGQQSHRRNPFLDIESEYGQEGMFGQRNQRSQRWNRNQFDTEEEYGQQSHQRNPFFETEMEDGMYGQGKRETKLHLNKFIHQCTIKITENGITATTGSQTEESYEPRSRSHHGRMGEYESEGMENFDEISGFRQREPTGTNVVKANRAFAFVLKHNPTQQLIMVGRVIDAAQKKVNHVPQTINNVDQF